METKANYLLIGLFTILGFLGLLGFVAWFSKAQLDQQFAYYDVYFENVSGLDRASTVKFAGLAVGQVVDLELSPSRDGTVRVVLEVAADTPVRASSVAKIEAQGVTGVSFVGISAGEGTGPILNGTRANMPTIQAGTSTLQALTQTAPKIADTALEAMERVNDLLSPENEAKVALILDNLAASSAQLDQTLRDFSTVSENVSTSVANIADFTNGLEDVAGSVENTLHAADRALGTIDEFAQKAEVTLEAGNKMLASANTTITLAGEFIDHEVSALVQDLTVTSAQFRLSAQDLSDQAASFMATWEETGHETTARLDDASLLFAEIEASAADFSATMLTMDDTLRGIDDLVRKDGTLLVAEARGAMQSADRALTPLAVAAEEQLPVILEDIRKSSETLRSTLTVVGGDLTRATGRVDGLSDQAEITLREVTQTFVDARETLSALNTTLAAADRSLVAAEGAFTGAQRIVDQDLSPITQGLRGTIARLNTALDQVSADIPAVTGSLKSASARADAAARRVGTLIDEIDGPVTSFANDGLPQYTRLAREARALVDVLESIAAQIERDPARFFLGGNTPRYRR